VEYDGTDLAGFQYQPDARTVQGELESAIRALTGQSVRVHGAGRTDAGVHALGQVVSFGVGTRIPVGRIVPAVNSRLPTDVRVVRAAEAEEGFHARFSARSRLYVYVVLNRQAPSALLGRYAWHIRTPLDVEAMGLGGARLVGTHDCAAWANSVAEARTTVRTVMRCDVRRRKPLVLLFVEAGGFLNSMVRNIAGTLVEVGMGRRAPEDVTKITESRNRAEAGQTAPACGLCLLRVRY